MEKIKETNSNFQTDEIFENVIVRIPALQDMHMKWVNKHFMLINSKEVLIRGHYRRGHKFGDNNFVTINYYDIRERVGETIVARVEFVLATNKKTGEIRFILDVYPVKDGKVPEYKLKIGSPTGEAKYLIPGTTKFIKFQEI